MFCSTLNVLGVTSKTPFVFAVAAAQKHIFRKVPMDAITLAAGLGVVGDAHSGSSVQHLYDKGRDPTRHNLRQVHLMEAELIDELKTIGFDMEAGRLGENITTRHIRLVELGAGTLLHLGRNAVIKVTGLRGPCVKIERVQPGLRHAVTFKQGGCAAMKGAIMAVVIASGIVHPGDLIEIEEPDEAIRRELRPV
jgi:MOSC domain-containing protein YiiM